MRKNKGKWILILIIIIVFIFIIIPDQDEDNIRLRVISNSNSEIDLKIKEEVAVILKSNINANDSYNDILNKMSSLEEEIDTYARKHNLDIKIDFGNTVFPPKQLNGKIISGGTYLTLLITIGEGKGNNYWTLLYPEYFNITFEEVYSGEVEIKYYLYEKVFKKN